MNGHPRGQGMVEFALGTLAFVPLLLFGIHFGEVMLIQMKVTEAATAPIWDATAGPMHRFGDLPSFTALPAETLTRAEAKARTRTARFDRLYAFTRSSNLAIQCGAQPVGLAGSYPLANAPALTDVVVDNGGISCVADGFLRTERIPDSYAEDSSGGFALTKMKDGVANLVGMKLCAFGRPAGLNGPCAGQLSTMVGDWGLIEGEHEDCGLSLLPPYSERRDAVCKNRSYYEAVAKVFDNSGRNLGFQGGGQPSLDGPASVLLREGLADGDANFVPPAYEHITNYYFSFRGEDTVGAAPPFEQLIVGVETEGHWDTTPFSVPDFGGNAPYRRSYETTVRTERCYLGQSCNTPDVNNP